MYPYYRYVELDALEFDEETEGTSYLADLNKAPDFIDEAPVEIAEVRHILLCFVQMLMLHCELQPEGKEAVKTTA